MLELENDETANKKERSTSLYAKWDKIHPSTALSDVVVKRVLRGLDFWATGGDLRGPNCAKMDGRSSQKRSILHHSRSASGSRPRRARSHAAMAGRNARLVATCRLYGVQSFGMWSWHFHVWSGIKKTKWREIVGKTVVVASSACATSCNVRRREDDKMSGSFSSSLLRCFSFFYFYIYIYTWTRNDFICCV